MAYRFEFAPEMVAQLDRIYEYMAGFSAARADAWYAGLFVAIETLATHPARCPVVAAADVPAEEVRMLLYGRRHASSHQVFFKIRGDVIRIEGIVNSRRSGGP